MNGLRDLVVVVELVFCSSAVANNAWNFRDTRE
jgi:hypothetical protein